MREHRLYGAALPCAEKVDVKRERTLQALAASKAYAPERVRIAQCVIWRGDKQVRDAKRVDTGGDGAHRDASEYCTARKASHASTERGVSVCVVCKHMRGSYELRDNPFNDHSSARRTKRRHTCVVFQQSWNSGGACDVLSRGYCERQLSTLMTTSSYSQPCVQDKGR